MRQLIMSALVQIMACRLFSVKPLSKPMLGYCQLDPREQAWVNFESKYFSFTKMHQKNLSEKRRPSCLGLNVLTRAQLEDVHATLCLQQQISTNNTDSISIVLDQYVLKIFLLLKTHFGAKKMKFVYVSIYTYTFMYIHGYSNLTISQS